MSNQKLPVGEELDPILLELGSALFVSQGLEGTLIFLLSVCTMEEAEMEERSFGAAMDALSKKTLGQLLKLLEARVELSSDEATQFRLGWKARNWIVHEFLHDVAEDLVTPKGRFGLSKRLAESKMVVKHTNELANRILDKYLEKYDISVEDMKVSADRLWEYINPTMPDTLN